MKCFHIALLLLLVLTGRTTGVLAANDHAAVASQQRILLPLPCPEVFRRTTPYQSPVRIDAHDPAANVFSPYDMYYANGLYCGNDEDSLGKDGSQANNCDASGATRAGSHDETPIGVRLGCYVQRYVSHLAAYGKMVAVHASHYWEQAAAFVRDYEKNREEAGLDPNDGFDCFAEGDRATLGEPVRREPVECLYVTSYKYNNGAILATLGKLTAESRLGSAPHATLLGEFYQIDEESWATLKPTADFAMPWQSSVGDASQDRNDQEQASAVPSVATQLECWAKLWLGEWNVVFRNISRQIARLDWTILLAGKTSDFAVRGTPPR